MATKYKVYLKRGDMMFHVLFWDNYGGRWGWHRNDDWDSASGFDFRKQAEAWAEDRLKLQEA